MKKVINLYKKYEEICNYVVVGGITTLVSLLTYYACVLTFLDPKNAFELQLANVISWICAVAFAYFANKKIVFKDNSKGLLSSIKFFLSRLSTLLIDMASMYILVTIVGINDKISKILVQFIVLVLNYILSKFLVFKKGEKNEKINKHTI